MFCLRSQCRWNGRLRPQDACHGRHWRAVSLPMCSTAARRLMPVGNHDDPTSRRVSTPESGVERPVCCWRGSLARARFHRHNQYNRNHRAQVELDRGCKSARKAKLFRLRNVCKLPFCGSRLISSTAPVGQLAGLSHSFWPLVWAPVFDVRISSGVRSIRVSEARSGRPPGAAAHGVLPKRPASDKVFPL